MGVCPTNCGSSTLVAYPQSSCDADLRFDTPARIFFFLCTTTLPSPITNANMLALFNSGDIVASMPLSNVEFGDVTYEEVQKDDCQTPTKIPVSRPLTFQDKYGVADTNSPSTGEYLDYDFWQDKLDNQTRLNYMVAYCNGNVKIARKEGTDTLLTASITSVLTYQKPQTAGNQSVEVKQVEMVLNGDPLDLRNKPEFNYIDAGIVL